jgi:hypothetical protein
VGFNIAATEPGTGVPPTVVHNGALFDCEPAAMFMGCDWVLVALVSAGPGPWNDVPHAPLTIIPSNGTQSNAIFGFLVTPKV